MCDGMVCDGVVCGWGGVWMGWCVDGVVCGWGGVWMGWEVVQCRGMLCGERLQMI